MWSVSHCFARCRFNVFIRRNQVIRIIHSPFLTIIYFAFGFPWKSSGGTRSPSRSSVSTPCWKQVSLDWECGYVECSSLEGTGVAAVFKSAKLITTLPRPIISPETQFLLTNFFFSPFPWLGHSPPSLSYFPRAGNYSRRLCCEARRHQFGERSEPRPRRRAARPPPSSTGCSAGRTAGGS